MPLSATRFRVGAIAAAAAAGLLALPFLADGEAEASTPRVVQDRLTPTTAGAGTTVAAELTVHSSKCFTAKTVGVAVRDAAGRKLDFPSPATDVRICPDGISVTTGARTLPAGTYTEYGFWRDDAGRTHKLPAQTLTVTAATAPLPVPSPSASGTPSPSATASPTASPTAGPSSTPSGSAGASATPTPTPSGTPTTAPTTTAPTTTPAGMRPLPDPLYGVTVDDVSRVGDIVTSSKSLSRMPTTRIVFDENVPPSEYASAIKQIQPVSYLMGEILDSYYVKDYSPQAYHDRVADYLNAFGDQVDIWEVGNEVNGNWLGSYADVSTKISDAYQQVEAAGKRSELTLYYDVGCGNGSSELDPLTFSKQYVPAEMRAGLDYVTLSYYEGDCGNIRPTAATWTSYFQQLHELYPNAKLGFGEIGLADPVTSSTQAKAESMLAYYYGLKIDLPYYAGGVFWWNYAEDMLPTTKPLWQKLDTAFTTMPTP
ncbi:hypothetical protein [Kitasatospora camelliae]|uniref:Uncharacterized protein n=1 Tax=Kitasatospora camelliae TaxID=3156397 RepID=A0AAU8K116_9ACTN